MGRYQPLHLAERARHRDETVALPEGRPARIAVISDTHGRPHIDCLGQVAARSPDLILHAGDIGDPTTLKPFAALAPTYAVRGNIDARGEGAAPDSLALRLSGDGWIMTVLLVHIALRGPRLRADTARFAKGHDASMVVCGHSHVPFIGRDRDLVVLNPGSIGPRRFRLPVTFAMMEVSAARLDMHHVSCDTGRRWMPGARDD